MAETKQAQSYIDKILGASRDILGAQAKILGRCVLDAQRESIAPQKDVVRTLRERVEQIVVQVELLGSLAKRGAAGVSFSEILAKNVRAVRTSRGWNQTDLADASKVDQGTISRIEGGQSLGLQVETAIKIANALGVSVDYLLGLGTKGS